MFIEILTAVVGPLVTKMADEFLGSGRRSVAVSDLQDQVAGLLKQQQSHESELAETRQAVVMLVRYLAYTRGDVFAIEDGMLRLLEQPGRITQLALPPVFGGFQEGVESRLAERRRQGADSGADSTSRRSVDPPVRVGESAEKLELEERRALATFFDGFSDEVMRARLEKG